MNPNDPKSDLEADFDPAEVDAAAQEITDPGVEPPPEVSKATENLTAWDEAPGSRGGPVEKFQLDEENQVGAELVQDGVESADRDSRLAAADPDYEP
jgi:hypothetical protein